MIEVEQLLKPVSVEEPGDKITLPNGQEKPRASAAQIKAAFRDTKSEELEGCGRAISDFHCARQGYRSVFDGNGRPRPAPDMARLVHSKNAATWSAG
jgi:hypothetical protein